MVVADAHDVGDPLAIFVDDMQALAFFVPHILVDILAAVLEAGMDPGMECFANILFCKSGLVLWLFLGFAGQLFYGPVILVVRPP